MRGPAEYSSGIRLEWQMEKPRMATDKSFAEHVMDAAGLGSRLTGRKMFGEYGFHLDGKFVALACDNSLFVKHTPALAANGLDLPMRPPYPGAKPYPVADELLDTPNILRKVLLDTADSLPKHEPKRASKRTGGKP
jgi:TfoX/Sxy family transcriptional regulator of competence genes